MTAVRNLVAENFAVKVFLHLHCCFAFAIVKSLTQGNDMATIDFTQVKHHDPLRHVYRVLGYRNGVRKMNSQDLTYTQARKLAKQDSTLSIYTLRGLCPSA